MLVSGSQEDLCEEEAAAGVSGGDQARVQVQGHRVILLLYTVIQQLDRLCHGYCPVIVSCSVCDYSQLV